MNDDSLLRSTAFAGGPANQLEVLLGDLEMLAGLLVLPQAGIHHALQDVLLRA